MKTIHSKRTRMAYSVLIGGAVGVLASMLVDWRFAIMIGWDVMALCIALPLLIDMLRCPPADTERIAKRDTLNHSILDTILVLASLASLGALAILLATPSRDASSIYAAFIGLVSIVISWATIHVLFSLRYAQHYFRQGGGIDFGDTTSPRFIDFIYLAFTIGMTYQVSDTTLRTSGFRRLAIEHALLSFIFGTTIIATTINLIVSLAK